MSMPPSTPMQLPAHRLWRRLAAFALLVCLSGLGLWAYQRWGFGFVHLLLVLALIFNINTRSIVQTLRATPSSSDTTTAPANTPLSPALRTTDRLPAQQRRIRWHWVLANLFGGGLGATLGVSVSLRLMTYRTTHIQAGTVTDNTVMLWSAGVGCLFLIVGLAQMIALRRYLFNPGFWIVAYSFGGIFISYVFQQLVAQYAWPWGEWGSVTLGMLGISLMQYRITLHTPQSVNTLWWPLRSTVCGSSIGLVLILAFGPTMGQPIDRLGWTAFWGLYWLGYGLGTMGGVVRWVEAICVPSETAPTPAAPNSS